MTTAKVKMWDRTIGVANWNEDTGIANFQYEPGFTGSGIEPSPISMPLDTRVYQFPDLQNNTFRGLPGLLADSLPDDFGNALIDSWLKQQGRDAGSLNPVERLCYVGKRGMGALEYEPAHKVFSNKPEKIEVQELVKLANAILAKRKNIKASITDKDLHSIFSVGTSAGGARAKAIIAWNEQSNEIRSGQVKADTGFSYWLLKFDGIAGSSKNYGRVEYAYYLMAKSAGIDMQESRLLEENDLAHFMTKRFDRTDAGGKIHMQSLCAMQHLDFRMPKAHSYEQALAVCRKLEMPMQMSEQLFTRMAFNIIARNQDDHVKNIAFLMDKSGQWSLSPAFDLTYSYNPDGQWTKSHQMSLNGKWDDFSIADFKECANTAHLKRGRAEEIINQVHGAVAKWEHFAEQANISAEKTRHIANNHRLNIQK